MIMQEICKNLGMINFSHDEKDEQFAFLKISDSFVFSYDFNQISSFCPLFCKFSTVVMAYANIGNMSKVGNDQF